jgi:hypothetical protein
MCTNHATSVLWRCFRKGALMCRHALHLGNSVLQIHCLCSIPLGEHCLPTTPLMALTQLLFNIVQLEVERH